MTILGPFVIIQRKLKLSFTKDQANPASLNLERYSLGLFEKPPSRGFRLIFPSGPKQLNKKVLHEPLKMTILGPCVVIPPRRLELIFTPVKAVLDSLRFEIYSLYLFEKNQITWIYHDIHCECNEIV